VAHTCSHKKQGYLHGGSGAHAEGEGKSPEEYRATHAKCASLLCAFVCFLPVAPRLLQLARLPKAC